MRCPNCKKLFANSLNYCPFCGAANVPTEKPVREKGGFTKFWSGTPVWGKVLLIVGLVAIVGIAIGVGASNESSTSKKTVSVTEDTATEDEVEEVEVEAPVATPAPEPTWQTAIDITSNSNKRTQPFYLGSGQKRLLYNVTGDSFSICSIYIMSEGDSLETSGGFPEVMANEPGFGETALVNSPGNYYLDVTSANCSWQVTVQELK